MLFSLSQRKAFFLLIAVMCVMVFILIPGGAEAARVITGDVITLGPGETVDDDVYLFGDTVTVSGTVLGDTVIFARKVIVDGKINGSLFIAADRVKITGDIDGTIRGGANIFYFQGTTAKDLIVAAYKINVAGSIGWDFLGAANNITVTGPVGRNVMASMNRLIVNGPVGGDIEADTSSLIIGPEARIDGKLTYTSEKEATIDQNALIGGAVKRLKPPMTPVTISPGRSTWSFVRPVLSLLVVALLMALLFPILTAGTARTIKEQPASSARYGALVVFAVPIAALILLITVIGLPVGLLTMLLYVVLVYLSRIFAGYFLAQLALDHFNKKLNPVWTALFGVLVLVLLTRIPFIGWLIHLAAVLVAAGAFIIYLTGNKGQISMEE